MKDTRPIDVQVAELTPEQKRKIPKIYKYHMIFSFVLIVGLLFALLFTHIGVVNAQSHLDSIKEKIASNGAFGTQYYADQTAAYDAYDAAVNVRTMVAIIGGIAVLVLAIGAQVFISKKFPFYSEKKYTHLKKAPRRG